MWALIGVLLAATSAVFIHDTLSINWLGAWLISVNLATSILFGIDKFKAQQGWMRIPENALLVPVLLGGPVGALAGMVLFRHKVSKRGFQNAFWTIVTLQIVVLCIWYFIVS